jgi:nicotinamidase-related amidase
MLNFAGKEIPERLEDVLRPGRVALLFWDVQVGIMSRVENSAGIIENMRRLRNEARQAAIPRYYSLQTPFRTEDEAPAWIRIKMRRARVADPTKIPDDASEGTAGWKLVEALKPDTEDTIFKKRRPSAFVGTDFDLMLRSRRIETVVLAGVTTESGIEGSARHGLNLGYNMVVVRDCVGSVLRERHETALKSMATFFDIANCDEIAAVWRSQS